MDGRETESRAIELDFGDGLMGEVTCCSDDDTARAAETIDGVEGVPGLPVDGWGLDGVDGPPELWPDAADGIDWTF